MNAMATKAPPEVAARPDASMSLLTNLIEHSLDEGYAEAAARRGEHEAPRRPGLKRSGLNASGSSHTSGSRCETYEL